MKCFLGRFRKCSISWSFIVFAHINLAYCVDNLNTPVGEVLVYATDPRIQYSPPLDDSSGVWNHLLAKDLDRNASQTSDADAIVSLVFQGSSLKLYSLASRGYPPLDVMLDNHSVEGHRDTDKKQQIVTISFEEPVLDPSVNHTVVVQKSASSSRNSSWNILAFGFTMPSPSPPRSPLPILSTPLLSSVSQTAESASVAEIGQDSKKLSGGAVAGIVVAVLFGIGFAAASLFCLRRRKCETVDIAPDPLVIPPELPSRDRPHFQRSYPDCLPHYTAPTSIWSSSVTHAVNQSSLPNAHGYPRQDVIPDTDPIPSPEVVKQRTKRRKPRFSGFFVANPSSHSSRSVRSQSLKDARVLSDRVPSKKRSFDLLVTKDEKMEAGLLKEKEWGPARVDRGKQKAVDFEIDPAPPERPRMTRKQSLRRFFFTTNPNPSTSSASSTSSLRRSATAKTAAVTDYVRDQIRRHRKMQAGHSQLPMSTSATAQPPVTIPERIPPGVTHALPQHNPVSRKPKKSRTSQTRFFTTNPSPSIPDSSTECAEAESALSQIPPSRKDKGKERAF